MCARKYTGKKKVYWGLIWALDWGCQDRPDRIKKSSNILSSQYELWSWWSFFLKRRHFDKQRIVYQLNKTWAGKTAQIRKWCLDVFQHPLLLIWLGGLLFWIPTDKEGYTLYFIRLGLAGLHRSEMMSWWLPTSSQYALGAFCVEKKTFRTINDSPIVEWDCHLEEDIA